MLSRTINYYRRTFSCQSTKLKYRKWIQTVFRKTYWKYSLANSASRSWSTQDHAKNARNSSATNAWMLRSSVKFVTLRSFKYQSKMQRFTTALGLSTGALCKMNLRNITCKTLLAICHKSAPNMLSVAFNAQKVGCSHSKR